jgi:hypothetical protein
MAERVLPPVPSLVKYDNPVLVTKHQEEKPIIKVKLGPSDVSDIGT